MAPRKVTDFAGEADAADASEPKLDVGFAPLRDQDLAAVGFGQAP